jgi:hypothetical protein
VNLYNGIKPAVDAGSCKCGCNLCVPQNLALADRYMEYTVEEKSFIALLLLLLLLLLVNVNL